MDSVSDQQAMAVRLERVIKAPIDKVWAYVGSERGIKEWIGPKEFRAELGGEVFIDTVHEGGHYHIRGKVVTYDPPNELAFTWNEQEVGKDPWPVDTTLRIVLTAVAGGTRVSLIHEGFEKLPAALAREQYEGYQRGWEYLNDLDKLAATIEGMVD